MIADAYTFRDPLLCTDGSIIGFYEREFYMFSNFSSFQVEWRGRVWSTSEHAYQAARFFDSAPHIAEQIMTARSAHDAYRLAQRYKEQQQAHWNQVETTVMYDICRHKLLQHEYIQQHLLSTNNERLVEDSPKDAFWGWGPHREGRNELGKIWMKLREELRDGKL